MTLSPHIIFNKDPWVQLTLLHPLSPSPSMASLHVAQCCPRPWLTFSAKHRDVAHSVDKPSPQSPLLRLTDLTAAG